MDSKKLKQYELRAGILFVVLLVIVGGWMLFRGRPPEIPSSFGQAAYAAEQGLPLSITNSLGMELRLIPPGSYQRGSPATEEGRTEFERLHRVRIAVPFYMAATEVTGKQYAELTGHDPSFFKDGPDHPVEQITWDEAIAFCNALSQREDLAPAYREEEGRWILALQEPGYRLPVEAEWEYACRAGSTGAFFTGSNRPENRGRENLRWAGWSRESSGGHSRPVGLRLPNAFGLYDMHGNVWEWCWDWFDVYPGNYHFEGPDKSRFGKVARGGGWFSVMDECRSASRHFHDPDEAWNMLGLRPVRSALPANGPP